MLTAALLAFLTSFDEVIISIFLSGGGNSTLTKQMFSALRDYIDPTIAAISTLMILLSTGLMLGFTDVWKKTNSTKATRAKESTEIGDTYTSSKISRPESGAK